MRERILAILQQHPGEFVSGEQISAHMNVTRAAVWKHIKALQQEGALIEAATRKGYRLIAPPDMLSAAQMEPLLSTTALGRHFVSLPEAVSTNAVARELARQGCESGTVVVADDQTLGRGRRGKSWQSTPGKDLLMSMVLRPDIETRFAPRFTVATALGVYRMAAGFGLVPEIKWPNDVLIAGKKLSGILLEMEGGLEALEAVIVGAGVNINTMDFPSEIRDTATSLARELGQEIPRKDVTATLLNELEPLYGACEGVKAFEDLMSEYRARCTTLSKPVHISGIREEFDGVAEDVDELGRLLVRLNSGELVTVSAGEVSVRASHAE